MAHFGGVSFPEHWLVPGNSPCVRHGLVLLGIGPMGEEPETKDKLWPPQLRPALKSIRRRQALPGRIYLKIISQSGMAARSWSTSAFMSSVSFTHK